jgi:hypothetical protein
MASRHEMKYIYILLVVLVVIMIVNKTNRLTPERLGFSPNQFDRDVDIEAFLRLGCGTAPISKDIDIDAVAIVNNGPFNQGGVRFHKAGMSFGNVSGNYTLTVKSADDNIKKLLNDVEAITSGSKTTSYGRFYNTDWCDTYISIACDKPGVVADTFAAAFIQRGNAIISIAPIE